MAAKEINVFMRGISNGDSKEVKAMACLAANGTDMALTFNEGPRIIVLKKHAFNWEGDKLAANATASFKFIREDLEDREAEAITASKDKLSLVLTDGETIEAAAIVDDAQTKKSLAFKQNMLPVIAAAKKDISVTVGEGGAISFTNDAGEQYEAALPALLFSYNVGQTATIKAGRNGQVVIWDRYDGQHIIGASMVAGSAPAAAPAAAEAPAEAAAPAADAEATEGVLPAEAEGEGETAAPAGEAAPAGDGLCTVTAPDGRRCTKPAGHDKKHWFGGTEKKAPAAPAEAAEPEAAPAEVAAPEAAAPAAAPAAPTAAPAAAPAKPAAPALPAANNGEVTAATVLAKLTSLEQAFGSAIRDIKITVKTLDAQKGADAKQLAELRKQLKMIAGAIGA